jgi:hypothetical protein
MVWQAFSSSEPRFEHAWREALIFFLLSLSPSPTQLTSSQLDLPTRADAISMGAEHILVLTGGHVFGFGSIIHPSHPLFIPVAFRKVTDISGSTSHGQLSPDERPPFAPGAPAVPFMEGVALIASGSQFNVVGLGTRHFS